MTRQGLKRLECSAGCGALAYMTLSQLERHGCPVCPCGAGMVPEDLEVAAAILSREALQETPAWRDFSRECRSVQHGQASHIQRGRAVRSDLAIAGERVAKSARSEARQRRLAGLVQFQQAAQDAAAIPF